MSVIKTLEHDQSVILKSILKLNGLDRYEVDLTYGNGSFYKNMSEPMIAYDLDPQKDHVVKKCSTSTDLPCGSVGSVVFDPPFLTYVRNGRTGNGKMIHSGRFSGYWTYSELEDHYKKTIDEVARIIKPKGVFVFKCQDIIHNHKMHCTHVAVIRWAEQYFRIKDLFILGAKHRMPSPNRKGTQRHARIFHSYFLVFERV